MKNITRQNTLTDQMRKLRKGQTVRIPANEYSYQSVRNTVCRLRKQGYDYICTITGCVNSTKVTRTL